MQSSRLEAFSDGVLAIIITIMVLELHLPDEPTFDAFVHETGLPLLTYLLSFIYVGIYWNNHHHLFQIVEHVDGIVLWANLHLLFWLSLFPLSTAWIDEEHVTRDPAILYGANLLGAAVAYYLLQLSIQRLPSGKRLAEALGRDVKGKISPVLYLCGIGLAFVAPRFSIVPYVLVALMWLVPDRRLEHWLQENAAD
ncbi:TMEM175 family protein [Nocardioides cheoyonin]|uniref:TMEM175 family protein n=1 Tax=Nocardioides cheoyonin TaxID=3156615 RepID=UPI0032B4DFA2